MQPATTPSLQEKVNIEDLLALAKKTSISAPDFLCLTAEESKRISNALTLAAQELSELRTLHVKYA